MSENDKWGAGDPAKWSDHGSVFLGNEEYPLIYGEHPHSRQDNHHYAVLSGGPMEFDGHRIQIDVHLESRNYLKESHYSGDEIRKGGSGKIIADGVQVFEFFFRDVQSALLRAHRLIGELGEHSSSWLMKREREKLVGRQIFYRECPAVIDRLLEAQGCLIIKTDDGKPFPPPVWRESDDDESEPTVKVEVTDPSIWWFRK